MVDSTALGGAEFEPRRAPPLAPGTSPLLVSGLVYRSLHAYIGAAIVGGISRVVEGLDPAVGAYLQRRFDMVSRFDALPVPCIALHLATLRGVSFEEHLRDANVHAEAQAGATYRGLLKVLSAEIVALAMPRASAIVHNFGRITTRVAGEQRVRGVRHGIPAALVRWVCLSSAYYLESALRRAGARESHTVFGAPVADGDVSGQVTYAVPFEVTWQR